MRCKLRYAISVIAHAAKPKFDTILHQRGYLPAAVESAVGRLRSLKYVNDEVFARDWALARAQGTVMAQGESIKN